MNTPSKITRNGDGSLHTSGLLCVLCVSAFIWSGCASTPPAPRRVYAPVPTEDGHGAAYQGFKESALLVQAGMDTDAIFKLLGLPDETSQAVVGAGTNQWIRLTWNYTFRGPRLGMLNQRSYLLDFHVTTNGYFVNDWHWQDN